MPDFAHMVFRAFTAHCNAVELAGQAEGEVADIDHFLDFAETFGEDFATFYGDKFAKIIFGSAEFFTEQADKLTTHRCGGFSPFFKRCLCVCCGFFNISRYVFLEFAQR